MRRIPTVTWVFHMALVWKHADSIGAGGAAGGANEAVCAGVRANVRLALSTFSNGIFWQWLVFSSSRFDHITPLLCQLHWLKTKERIDFKLAVLVYKCLHETAPSYLADELCQPVDLEARRCLRSASSPSLIVRAHSSVHYWRSSIPGRRLPYLEQSATARYVCTLTACLCNHLN